MWLFMFGSNLVNYSAFLGILSQIEGVCLLFDWF